MSSRGYLERMSEALTNDMGARENPPAGLIAHVVTETANGIHVR